MKKVGVMAFVLCAAIACAGVASEKSEANKKLQSVNALIEELAKDGAFSKSDAESVALEVARRLWWPDSNKIAVRSASEKDGTWTVHVEHRKGSPADPGGEVIIAPKEWFLSARYLPGE